jgi:hypothetical protein
MLSFPRGSPDIEEPKDGPDNFGLKTSLQLTTRG